jgi:hypothetical protein
MKKSSEQRIVPRLNSQQMVSPQLETPALAFPLTSCQHTVSVAHPTATLCLFSASANELTSRWHTIMPFHQHPASSIFAPQPFSSRSCMMRACRIGLAAQLCSAPLRSCKVPERHPRQPQLEGLTKPSA